MAITRISITIPRQLLTALDRRAKQLDRSRSWAIAEAVRRFLGRAERTPAETTAGKRVHQPVTSASAAVAVAAARRRHLGSELALPVSERLRRAEELGKLGRQAQRRATRQQVIGFDSYEDYYQWKQARLVGG